MDQLITHGLNALRETLQQDKELTALNSSIGVVGPPMPTEKGISPEGPFRILDSEFVTSYIASQSATQGALGAALQQLEQGAAAPAEGDEDVEMEL